MTDLTSILEQHGQQDGPLLPILHAVQSREGYVSEEAMRAIAAYLNITRAEVFGVVSFYHDFRLTPATKPALKICRAEACQARGVEALLSKTGMPENVALEPVYCLGLCSVGPAALTEDGTVHARLDTEKLAKLIEAIS